MTKESEVALIYFGLSLLGPSMAADKRELCRLMAEMLEDALEEQGRVTA